MSFDGNDGFEISFYKPFTQDVGHLFNWDSFGSYSHEILADGGFWSASLSRAVTIDEAEDWYSRGLTRGMLARNAATDTVFKGFVNQVTINMGGQNEVRGPVMDMANRVSANYSPKDVSVFPPVIGAETVTPIAEDLTSQALYGIVEKIISVGQVIDADALQVRDVFLEENRQPRTSGNLALSPGGGKYAEVTLDILGNIHWLNAFFYDSAVTGFLTVYDKIIDILGLEPNNVLSPDVHYIQDNLYLTAAMTDTLKTGWDELKGLLSLGNDTSFDRRTFGVYDADKVYYSVIESAVFYNHRLTDPAQRITTPGNNWVRPWDVRPAHWLFVPDFLAGKVAPDLDRRQDPRYKFLDSVRYTAPYTLDLSGGRTDRLSQMLARITYSGGI